MKTKHWLCAIALLSGAGCLDAQNRRPIDEGFAIPATA